MEIVRANKENLSSILMGKNLPFAWRGQRDLIITVPYTEWYEFIKEYNTLLCYRKPLNYSRMFERNDIELNTRYFWFEMSWALYSELAYSSNIGQDATLILPYFENGKPMDMMSVLSAVKNMSGDMIAKCHDSLIAATRNYYTMGNLSDLQFGVVQTSNLSEWNKLVFYLCIYLQSRSSNTNVTEKLNIYLEV